MNPVAVLLLHQRQQRRSSASLSMWPAIPEPPMPNRMLMVGNSVITGVTTLMADMPSGPIRLLTTMASVRVASRWASAARTEANINDVRALDIRKRSSSQPRIPFWVVTLQIYRFPVFLQKTKLKNKQNDQNGLDRFTTTEPNLYIVYKRLPAR